MENAVLGLLRATHDLKQQLQQTTMEQAADLAAVIRAGHEMIGIIRNIALAADTERLEECSERFNEYIEHILEVR